MNRMLHSIRSATLALCAGLLVSSAMAATSAYVGNFKDDTVSVVDVDTAAVVATIPVAKGPHGMTASADGRRVYVSGDGSSQVDVIDVASGTVARSVAVGRTPHGLARTVDGRFVLAAVYGEDRVAFLATGDDTVAATVPLAKPHTIAVAPDGHLAYVSSQEPGAFALVVVDLERRVVVRRVALEKPPRDLEFAPDGRALYFTLAGVDAVQVLDPRDDRIVAQIATGASPHIATAYRGAPAGTIVVQGPSQLQLFDPATNAPTRTIAVGRQPHWIAWAGPTPRVVVTGEGSNDLTIVNLADGTTRAVAVGSAPRKVVVIGTGDALHADAGPGTRPTGGATDVHATIAGFAFAPLALHAVAGATVTWTNADGAPHGLAFADGTPGRDPLLPGESFARVYAQAGDFAYGCPIHPFMQGHVVVAPR